MAVNTYDSRQAFRQDAIARLGEKGGGSGQPMSKEDRKKFEASPFMQQMKVVESVSLEKTNARDKKRQKTDPSFQPKDSDFNAPKSFNYSKTIDYYGVLGIDEYATLDEVKKVYRKLSLSFHPDKMTNKTQEEKDEAAVIFIEVKNAYKLLSDPPTRRQYDHDRDRDVAGAETNGSKVKKPEVPVNAAELLNALQKMAAKNKKDGGQTVKVNLSCKLEKFIYGGQKAEELPRRVKDKMEFEGFRNDFRLYRIDLPRHAGIPYVYCFKKAGDQYADADPDDVEFTVSPKPHSLVDVQGNDLVLRKPLELGTPSSLTKSPFLETEADVLVGRQVLLWGQNPFYRSRSKFVDLRIRIHGQGANDDGALSMGSTSTLEGGVETASTAGTSSSSVRRLPEEGRDFLQSFGLEPPWGFCPAEEEQEEPRVPEKAALLQRRVDKNIPKEAKCEIDLARVGQPLALFTKPPCTISFYMNRKQKTPTPTSQIEPAPMLAICLTAPACAAKKAASAWDTLRKQVVPLLKKFGFLMVRSAQRRILLRCLEGKTLYRVLPRFAPALSDPKVYATLGWKKSGDAAFARGDMWYALQCYSHSLSELEESNDLIPKVLSNRSACFAKMGEYAAAMADAQNSAELDPKWGRAWSRVGLAAWHISGTSNTEALDAYTKAAELDPSVANVRTLQSIAAQMEGPNEEAAHQFKEKGNEAMQHKDYATAVAAYTIGIGKLPAAPDKPKESKGDPFNVKGNDADPQALLRAIMFSNRAAAYVFLRRFDEAIVDGRTAVGSNATFVKARCQLGVALLARGLTEQAYEEFAKAVQLEPENQRAAKGRKACLTIFQAMKSLPPRLRLYSRSRLDVQRAKGSTRIFAVSDVHCDRKEMEDWIHALDSYMFQDDVLIVAGNLACQRTAVQRGLSVLKSKFRRVFYTIGNFETWLAMPEWGKYPDSIAKINSIFEACDELGVDVFPAQVCQGLHVVPLMSWYNAEFDAKDPLPNGKVNADDRAKWPMDPDMQLWKYMLRLNEEHLKWPMMGTVISFSHFLPRQDLPLDPEAAGMVKTCGCTDIDAQVRRIKSKVHVYGHTGVWHAQAHDGVKYVNCPVAYTKSKLMETRDKIDDKDKSRQFDIEPRLMMVYNGKDVCMQEWGVDGEPPLGHRKRIQHIAVFMSPKVSGSQMNRALHKATENMTNMKGMEASFNQIAGGADKMKTFMAEIWPDIKTLDPFGSTHVLHMVADDFEALKTCMASTYYRTDFMGKIKEAEQGKIVVQAPLGMDLQHAGKGREDPTLVIFLLRLAIRDKEREGVIEQMEKAVAQINNPAFATGRLSAGLQAAGVNDMTAKELAKELNAPELTDSAGCTHVLSFYVNTPETFKLLSGSKTFSRLRGIYAPYLITIPLPGGIKLPAELAYVVPLDITVNAAAPKPPKKVGRRRKH